jgi:hypothetical protein
MDEIFTESEFKTLFDYLKVNHATPQYVAVVHSSVERDLRRLNAQMASSPIGKHMRRAGARGHKQALMASWHPRKWVKGD